MRKSVAICAAVAFGALAFMANAYAGADIPNDRRVAEEGAGKHNTGGNRDHDMDFSHMCARIIPFSEADVPDIHSSAWEKVREFTKAVERSAITYSFYRKAEQGDTPVTAVTVSGSFTNIIWETGDVKRKAVLEAHGLGVCEMPLYGKDGKRYDVADFMDKISRWAEKQ